MPRPRTEKKTETNALASPQIRIHVFLSVYVTEEENSADNHKSIDTIERLESLS